ncbi:hypothetical protein WMY93_028523 [Mugilogobius chulae]|uniref:O-methyltransferase C-terminal domain-containing protein n=1 Tax=Mugilogobius chulae TaxID=88201 RepID=A0AAW0MXK9_9GOBI
MLHGPTPHSALQSLNMLVQTEGTERTQRQYTKLLKKQGFGHTQVAPDASQRIRSVDGGGEEEFRCIQRLLWVTLQRMEAELAHTPDDPRLVVCAKPAACPGELWLYRAGIFASGLSQTDIRNMNWPLPNAQAQTTHYSTHKTASMLDRKTPHVKLLMQSCLH